MIKKNKTVENFTVITLKKLLKKSRNILLEKSMKTLFEKSTHIFKLEFINILLFHFVLT